MTDRIGNVTRQRYEQLVTQAKDLIAQVAHAQFSLGDMASEIEPMRAVDSDDEQLLRGRIYGHDTDEPARVPAAPTPNW